MIGIYGYYFNDQLIYVGQSVDIKRRIYQHAHNKVDTYPLIDGFLTEASSGSTREVYEATEDNGAMLRWTVLEECPAEQLNDREQFYIQQYKSQLLNQENPARLDVFNNLLDTLEDIRVEDELDMATYYEDHYPCQGWFCFRKESNRKKVQDWLNQYYY